MNSVYILLITIEDAMLDDDMVILAHQYGMIWCHLDMVE